MRHGTFVLRRPFHLSYALCFAEACCYRASACVCLGSVIRWLCPGLVRFDTEITEGLLFALISCEKFSVAGTRPVYSFLRCGHVLKTKRSPIWCLTRIEYKFFLLFWRLVEKDRTLLFFNISCLLEVIVLDCFFVGGTASLPQADTRFLAENFRQDSFRKPPHLIDSNWAFFARKSFLLEGRWNVSGTITGARNVIKPRMVSGQKRQSYKLEIAKSSCIHSPCIPHSFGFILRASVCMERWSQCCRM